MAEYAIRVHFCDNHKYVGLDDYQALDRRYEELSESHKKLAKEWTDQTVLLAFLSRQIEGLRNALKRIAGEFPCRCAELNMEHKNQCASGIAKEALAEPSADAELEHLRQEKEHLWKMYKEQKPSAKCEHDNVTHWDYLAPKIKYPKCPFCPEKPKGEKNEEIEKVQFTAWDEEHYPEFNNSLYLDYERVKTGLSSEICKYGYKKKIGEKYFWVPKPTPPLEEKR